MAKQMLSAHLQGEAITTDELLAVDIFKDMKPATIEKYPGTVVRRRVRPGEMICRQGEGGTTAFYIVEGTVRVYIERSDQQKKQTRADKLKAAVASLLGRTKKQTESHDENKLIPIDATADLTYGNLATTLAAGDLFGEMSCLNLAPRSATVVAETECVLVEILRNMYEQLQKSPAFKEQMDAKYRARALGGHLRNVPIFADLDDEDIDRLRESAELLTVPAGQPVFKQDDESDGLYIIRLGQVKVSQRMPGGERTLAYLTRGDCFGEMGLLHGTTRNATCSAVDHPIIEDGRKRRPAQCELVRISPADFKFLLDKHEPLRKRLEALSGKRQQAQEQAALTVGASDVSPQAENLGLLQGQNLMLIDMERCTRCDQCVDACVSAHDDGLPRLVRDGPQFEQFLVPSTCRMCKDPACMIGCPVGSIRRTGDLNILIEDWCIGCGVCAKQCPYDAIQMHGIGNVGDVDEQERQQMSGVGDVVAVTERAVVCDQCSSLPTGPACVYSCPHDAAIRIEGDKFLGLEQHR